MQLELRIHNDLRAMPSVAGFVQSTFQQVDLPAAVSQRLQEFVLHVVRHAVENAYPSGDVGWVMLSINQTAERLEMAVRDYGLPQDVHLLEEELHESDVSTLTMFAFNTSEIVDEMHYIAFGPEGKSLQLIKWLNSAPVASSSAPLEQPAVTQSVPSAPDQEYSVRRMRSDDALQISQLIYRIYGDSYFNEDVYYPDRIASENARQALISAVAVDESGHIVGHCALELNQPGPVAELGQAAVDPRHRGRGLLDKMKSSLISQAEDLNLLGWYSESVAVHTYTQKSNASHGGHVCGASLAISPKSESFRGISAQQSQRVSCIRYFHWLTEPKLRKVYVPARHREIVAAIYEGLECPYEFGDAESEPCKHGTFSVKVNARAQLATLRVSKLGNDSVYRIRHAIRQLVERARVDVVIVELPLDDPATPGVCEKLEQDGLGFTGIGPHFATMGDVLRSCYLVEPLAREPIKTFEAFASDLVDYALAEQRRVRRGL